MIARLGHVMWAGTFLLGCAFLLISAIGAAAALYNSPAAFVDASDGIFGFAIVGGFLIMLGRTCLYVFSGE